MNKTYLPTCKVRTRAFTLIELMVVLAVIGVLVGILFSGATYLLGDQKEKQGISEIKILQLALEEFSRDFGTFPLSGDGDDVNRATLLLNVLQGTHDENGDGLRESQIRRSYIPLDKFVLGLSDNDEQFLQDPWELPYQYQFPRLDGHPGYLLFSKGPDRESQIFEEELDGVPQKLDIDLDNIPPSEPGKW